MHFFTLLSISHFLPANAPVKSDYISSFHPPLCHVSTKQAVDTEPEVLFLDYAFLSALYFKISMVQS